MSITPSGFDEVLFPVDISWGAKGGPEFSTTIVETAGGYEQRNINWSAARGSWTVGHNLKSDAQRATLMAFFRARFGKARGFLFKDWLDYQGTAENLGTGDGTTTAFQLQRVYLDAASNTYTRSVSKPITGTVNVYLNGVLQATGYTVDYTTGIIAFTTAPLAGVVVTADFQFNVPVRFDTDKMDMQASHFNLNDWDGIPIVEIRV